MCEQNAVFCSRFLLRVNRGQWLFGAGRAMPSAMMQSLFDKSGNRKYLVAKERQAFASAATTEGGAIATFCLTLAVTGARISEVLALTSSRIDSENRAVVFETLKQRKRGVFRAVPVPDGLIQLIELTHSGTESGQRLWPWGRTAAWKCIKRVMSKAGIAKRLSMPKALRHAFAVEAGQQCVPLNIVQRWLGHARIETTAIYAGALGDEERCLASRSWKSLEETISKQTSAHLMSVRTQERD
ncbi:MAG: integrase family protein [Spartobacteria bacterium]|nr:integrase family protein [Spartobacteria bacterium]